MAKYRKKPVVIEAEQFVGPCTDYFMGFPIHLDGKGFYLIIPTLEGDHRADENDWIIKGVVGEFYPCKPDIFEKTYEKVDG